MGEIWDTQAQNGCEALQKYQSCSLKKDSGGNKKTDEAENSRNDRDSKYERSFTCSFPWLENSPIFIMKFGTGVR